MTLPKQWNRKTRRQMSRLGIGQKLVEEQMQKVYSEGRTYAFREAWGAMMLALHKEYGFDGDKLHQLAVHTLNNINRYLCPADMIRDLKAATGFDVNQPIPDEELEPFDPDGIIDDLEGCEDG